MRSAKRVVVRAAVLGGIALALLAVKPAAFPGGGSPLQIETVDGAAAVAGEVLVKFRRTLPGVQRRQLQDQVAADSDTAIGGLGVRRMHSRQFDTSTLLAFLRHHPDVEYAVPNYI